MARIGYIRISTSEQNTDRQETALADCSPVFIDRCSGKDTSRPELDKMLTYIRTGDTVVIESFSRLARSTRELLRLVDFIHQKGAELVSLKENVDTSTPQGQFMLSVFGAMAELERNQMLQRQAEGIAEAKKKDAESRARGEKPAHYPGRKRLQIDPEEFAYQYERWKDGKQTAVKTMQKLGLRPGTFYRRVMEYEEERGIRGKEGKP